MAARTSKKKELVIPAQRVTKTKIFVGGPILVTHRFSEKMKRQMLEAQQGKARNKKEARDPEAEYQGARYLDVKGYDCMPATAFKKAIIDAASFVQGVTKVQIRGAIFVKGATRDADNNDLIPIRYSSMEMREDVVRLGNGSADLRYRPQYNDWEATLELEFDPDILSAEQVHHLVQRAGFAIGVGEGRPQKNGDWGRFELKKAATRRLSKSAAKKKTTRKKAKKKASKKKASSKAA